jgi:RNA recognition motif-containing protein
LEIQDGNPKLKGIKMAVRLFVGNLPYSATEAELRELFSAVGPVSYISLPTDRETGKMRGFAFIEYSDRAQAEEAIRRFNNQPFKGRPLAVNEARPREDRPSGGAPRPPQPLGPDMGEPPPRGEGPRRNFGPDAAPRRNKKQQSRSSKTERGPKGPIPVRTGGQLLWDDEDESYDEPYDGDQNDENFASRESEDEDND